MIILRPLLLVMCTMFLLAGSGLVRAQQLFGTPESTVDPRVETLYSRGLSYLVNNQKDEGYWPEGNARQPGVVGMAVLAMLAHGDDPNAGPYSLPIKRGLSFILDSQDAQTGYIGNSMYNHGFATLALAEAYGAVDDERLGSALTRAVRLLLTAQNTNAFGAWRYRPDSNDADTTVSGACLVALYAARNAGIAVPDNAFDRAMNFYRLTQSENGGFGYTHPSDSSPARGAIGLLVFSLAKDKQSRHYKDAYGYLHEARNRAGGNNYYYYLYYASQAFFHGAEEGWAAFNEANIATLASTQNTDGSWQGNNGATASTAMALLSLALNYRFLPIYER